MTSGRVNNPEQIKVNCVKIQYHEISRNWKKFCVEKLLDGFLESKLTGNKPIAPSYVRHYKRYVGIAKDYFGITDVRDLRKLDIVSYGYPLSSR